MTKKNVFLIGTGPMAVDYAKVLKTLNTNIIVIGRGEKSAFVFEAATGLKVVIGGFENYVLTHSFPSNAYVIIATGTEALMPMLLLALNGGAGTILIEKPAAISIKELLENAEYLKNYKNKVFVAYNRRFYASVIEAQRLIDEDGGLESMHFEFTEWAHKIEPLEKALGVKENWFFANSTHVVDLAFYIAGNPKHWHAYSKEGQLTWHDKTNFVGAGITEKGALFSYISNWESAGRWGIELLTNNRRIYLKPLEGILLQHKGSVQLNEHKFDNQIDIDFKPGLFLQTKTFLNNNFTKLKSIEDHIFSSNSVYLKILG
jgi:predicted dehydrogenase